MKTYVIICACMLAMSGVASLWAAETPTESEVATRGNSALRSLSAIQVDVQAALRAEALSRREGANVPEVMRLVELYREMADHPRRETNDFLAELGLKVRSRLKDVCEHIERKRKQSVAKVGRPSVVGGARSGDPRTTDSEDPRTTVPATVVPETQVLAQQIGVPGGGRPGQGAQPSGGRPGSAPSVDYGPELVGIIQAVISPATWDINGGRSTIVYYEPLHVLVVSAPDEVHPQIGNLLGQLRAAP